MNLCSHGCGREGAFYSSITGNWRCSYYVGHCPAYKIKLVARGKTRVLDKAIHVCPTCGKKLRKCHYVVHVPACKGAAGQRRLVALQEMQQPNGKYKCRLCAREFSKFGIGIHMWSCHTVAGRRTRKKCAPAWNKGLTKETDPRIKQQGEVFSARYKQGLCKPLGHPCSEDQKKKLSNIITKRHKAGTAHNIGSCRWAKEKSWPEQFFVKVIENEFGDKSYEYDKIVGNFKIDFAWVHKMRGIELDGEQHERVENKERDLRKDAFLKQQGWEIMRISWKDMHRDTKKYILLAKEFIHQS